MSKARNLADLLEADGDVKSGNLDNATSTLDGATDTNITSVADNDLLAYDSASSKWINQSASEAGIVSEVVGDTTPQLGGVLDTNGNNIEFGDNDKAVFGAGDDLEIYHDGSNSYIDDAGTGNLNIRANNLVLGKYTGETYISAAADGTAKLFYDGTEKLATTSTGVDVTGTITFDGGTTSADLNFGDSDKAVFGAGSDLQIYHNGTRSLIDDVGTGDLVIRGTNIQIKAASDETFADFSQDGAATLYHNNSSKLATSSSGVTVTGTVTATSFSGSGSGLTGVPTGDFSNPDGDIVQLTQAGTDPYSNHGQNKTRYQTYTLPGGAMATVAANRDTYISARNNGNLKLNGNGFSGNPATVLNNGHAAMVVNTGTSNQSFTVGLSGSGWLSVGEVEIG